MNESRKEDIPSSISGNARQKKETQKKFDVVFCAKRVVKWPRIRNKGVIQGIR